MTTFISGEFAAGGSHGKIQHFNVNGISLGYLEDAKDDLGNLAQVNGITFDSAGNIYTALAPTSLNKFPFPWDVVWMPLGEALISIMAISATRAELWKVSLDGTQVLKTYSIPVDDTWNSSKQMKVDIACDSKTVYYSDQGNHLFKYDISGNGTSLGYAVTATDPYLIRAFKLLPDGTFLVNQSQSGNGPAHALCLSGDGTTFWIDEINPPDDIYHIFRRNISTFVETSNVLANVNPDSTTDNKTDIVWSLGSYYGICNFPGLAHYDEHRQ